LNDRAKKESKAMTRIDCRPYVALILVTAVFTYVGCTSSSPAPQVASSPPPTTAAAGSDSAGSASAKPEKLLENWVNPAAVLVVSGEDDGYMEPCGCSAEQIGGLIRRSAFIDRLHNQKWPTAQIHLGGLIKNPGSARGGAEQARMKFDYAVQALKLLSYSALGLCTEDLKVGVQEALGVLDNNLGDTTKIVVANVQPEAVYEKLFRPSVVVTAGPVKLGITSVTDPDLLAKLNDSAKDSSLPSVKRPEDVLPAVLAALEAKSDFQVLMVQGPPALAKQLGEAYPGFDVVVATSETVDPLNHEPEPLNGGKTLLVSIGKKGKYVGALGFFPSETPRVRFELVTLDKRFDGGGAPMKKLIEDDYRGMLKVAKTVENYGKRNFIGGAPGAAFVGAATCKECHPKTFAFWSGTKHAGAFESLLHDPKPNSAFDAECVSCHTTGFEYHSGWLSPDRTPNLAGNQCENCHGPGSKHAQEPDNDKFRELMSVTIEQADKNQLCSHCHDEDNSRDFEIKKYWRKIRHSALDVYNDPKVHRGIAPKSPEPPPAAKVP
jgi:hypothetical protein